MAVQYRSHRRPATRAVSALTRVLVSAYVLQLTGLGLIVREALTYGPTSNETVAILCALPYLALTGWLLYRAWQRGA